MHLKPSLLLIPVINLLLNYCTPCLALTYTPANLIIATDLDDVLLNWDKSAMFKVAFKDMQGLMSYYKQTKKRRKIGGSFGHKYGESLYIQALEKGNMKAARFLRRIATQKNVNKDVLHAYQELNKAGYAFYTATNIGDIFFEDLQKRFPDIFNDSFIKQGMTVDYGTNDIIEKPDYRYYKELEAKLNPAGDMHILFIDDRKENVDAARACGLEAIQFKNHKQLVRDLHKYNICLCNGSYKAA